MNTPGVALDIMKCPQVEVWSSMIQFISKGLAFVPLLEFFFFALPDTPRGRWVVRWSILCVRCVYLKSEFVWYGALWESRLAQNHIHIIDYFWPDMPRERGVAR